MKTLSRKIQLQWWRERRILVLRFNKSNCNEQKEGICNKIAHSHVQRLEGRYLYWVEASHLIQFSIRKVFVKVDCLSELQWIAVGIGSNLFLYKFGPSWQSICKSWKYFWKSWKLSLICASESSPVRCCISLESAPP